jgi:hypothetical protein
MKNAGTTLALLRCRRIKWIHIRRATMPIILWLLGVPLSLIIVLALLGVF